MDLCIQVPLAPTLMPNLEFIRKYNSGIVDFGDLKFVLNLGERTANFEVGISSQSLERKEFQDFSRKAARFIFRYIQLASGWQHENNPLELAAMLLGHIQKKQSAQRKSHEHFSSYASLLQLRKILVTRALKKFSYEHWLNELRTEIRITPGNGNRAEKLRAEILSLIYSNLANQMLRFAYD